MEKKRVRKSKSGMLDSRREGGDKLRRINAIYHLEMFPREMRKKGMREKERDASSAGRIKKNREREGEQVGRREVE